MNAEKTTDNLTSVQFFLGPGGVGKSTISALRAIDMALSDKKTLIATFDPSPRLKDILVHEGGFNNPKLKKNLEVVVLDSRKIFEDLLSHVDPNIAQSIKKNKLFKHLIERIQGVQEFTSLYFLSEHVQTSEYDIIVIDTPPLQNSIDFFSSPQKLKDLFESTIVKLFIGDFNRTWFEKIFKKTRDIAFGTLKKLTGHDFFDQLISFMKALEKLQPVILKTLNDSEFILLAKSTEYSFVTSYEEQNLSHAEKQMSFMAAKKLNFHTLFINRYSQIDEIDLNNLINQGKALSKRELIDFLTYKKEKADRQDILLKKVKTRLKLKILTLNHFGAQDMKEENLIIKSREFNEYNT